MEAFSLMDLPLELRDEIVELCVFHVSTVPPQGNNLSQHASKYHICHASNPNNSFPSQILTEKSLCYAYMQLLLVSRQIHTETTVVMKRYFTLKYPLEYKLDLLLESEKRFRVTWTNLPFFKDSRFSDVFSPSILRLASVEVDVRFTDEQLPSTITRLNQRGRLLKGGAGGPARVVWDLLTLLNGFIRYGPSFCPPESANLSAPRDEDVQVDCLSVNVLSPPRSWLQSTVVHPNTMNNHIAGYRAPESAVYYWVSHGVSALLYRREGRIYNRHFLAGISTFQLSMDGQSRKSWDVAEARLREEEH
jgi:hypothetical protein